MKTIKNFNTEGGEISLSFEMSNVNGLLPIFTEVYLEIVDNGNFYSKVVASSTDNTANIPSTSIGDSINHKNGTLVFETMLQYDNEESLDEQVKALDLKYSLSENGNNKVYTKCDDYYPASKKKLVKIVKNIDLS